MAKQQIINDPFLSATNKSFISYWKSKKTEMVHKNKNDTTLYILIEGIMK